MEDTDGCPRNSKAEDLCPTPGSKRRPKTRTACERCRSRKIRCDGLSTCTPCQQSGSECKFSKLEVTSLERRAYKQEVQTKLRELELRDQGAQTKLRKLELRDQGAQTRLRELESHEQEFQNRLCTLELSFEYYSPTGILPSIFPRDE